MRAADWSVLPMLPMLQWSRHMIQLPGGDDTAALYHTVATRPLYPEPGSCQGHRNMDTTLQIHTLHCTAAVLCRDS